MVSPDHHFPRYATPFIGRDSELEDITRLLTNPACRLLTLIGLGGVGKTRLAIEIAARLADEFPDGIYFVPLQSLQSPDQLVTAVIAALNLQQSDQHPQENLLRYLTKKRLLLLLDNFEHLREGGPLLGDILNTASHVKLLVTSREALRLQDEWLRQVRGLDYPAETTPVPDGTSSAVQLFVNRAQRLRGDLDIDTQHPHIVRICQLVEGMPLALELAAGWVKSLSCPEIAHELQHNLVFLSTRATDTPARHRSMQVVFDYSWQMLTLEEQVTLSRFSVFRGGCTRAAAEQVTGATLGNLASLVEKSLLRHNPNTGRYDIHELLRQYAEEKLLAAGEETLIRDTHAKYYGATFHARENDRRGPRQIAYWDAIGADLDNIRVVWAWALQRENYEIIYQLTEPVWSYFFFRSRTFEANVMYATARHKLEKYTDQREQAILAHLLSRIGGCGLVYYHFEEGEAALRQSMAIAQAQHDLDAYYYAYRLLGKIVWQHDGYAQIEFVRQAAEAGIAYYRQHGDHFYLSHMLEDLAYVYESMNQMDKSRPLLLESLELRRAHGDLYGIAVILGNLGTQAMVSGHWDEAERYLTEALDRQRESGSKGGIMMILARLSQVALATGDFQRARHYAQDILTLLEQGGVMFQQHWPMLTSYRCLGLIAVAQGNYVEARQIVDIMFANLGKRGGGRGDSMFLRIWVWCGQGQFDTAADDLCEVLPFKLQWYQKVEVLFLIAAITFIFSHRGEYVRATELLGLVFSRLESPRGYLEKHQGIIQLRVDLEAQLGLEAYTAAWSLGAQLDIQQVVAELMHEFSRAEDDSITRANDALLDPLTPRELEVLRLLEEGLTNPQIAERLVITTGAVKRYTSNIYGKLTVKNRAQAVSQAQALGLLQSQP